jgi:predicted DNA-binding mobile mystery protein A
MKTKFIDPRYYRDQLECRLLNLRHPFEPSVPERGWIRTLRQSLRLTQRDLAARCKCRYESIRAWEKAEISDHIQLETLKRAAEAMDCELIYFFAPKKGMKSYTEILQKIHGRRRPLIIAPRDLLRSVSG